MHEKTNYKYKGKLIFIFICGCIILCAMGICYWFNSLVSVKEAQISESWAKYDQAVKELDQTIGSLRKNIIENAKSSYESNGYEAALKVIDDGLAVLENDDELKKLREKYENLKPVMLVDVPFHHYDDNDSDENNKSFNDAFTDQFGNQYNSSISVYDQGSLSWNLEGKYNDFTGVIACPEGYTSGFMTSDVTVKIYGDETLLFTSNAFGPESAPQEFHVNLHDVGILRIEWSSEATFNFWQSFSNYATIFDGQLSPDSL